MEVVNVDTLIKLIQYLGCTVEQKLIESWYDKDDGYVEGFGVKITLPNGKVVQYERYNDDDEIESFLHAIKKCEEVMGKNIVKRNITDKTIGVKIDWYPTD